MGDEEPRRRPTPPLLREEQDGKKKVRVSKANEHRLAKELGGRRVAGSGNRLWSRSDAASKEERHTLGGDIKTPEFYLEHKGSERDSIGVKREWLRKITEASKRQAKDPGLVLTFEDAEGFEKDWVAFPLSVIKRLLGKDIE